jgi:glycosyltransferase involved in cell wall biosynthesis
VLLSEHWSAYHDNFYLPENSPALDVIRRPFTYGFPVLPVSKTLLEDIQKFAKRRNFPGHIIPNHVPLHGNTPKQNETPILFAVNIWREIKEPLPMLEGLAAATANGSDFRLVLGGFGELVPVMKEFVAGSVLADRTHFLGKMTKAEIAQALAEADANLFSSRYETFSVACAEALGAGVPLIGPNLDAIAEYAGPDDWVRVESRDAAGWADAVTRFVARQAAGEFNGAAIAARAEARFAPEAIRARYRDVMAQILPRGPR